MTMQDLLEPKNPPPTKLLNAFQGAEALGKSFFEAIGHLPESMDRTYARQFAEDALAHVTKIREEYDDVGK